MGWDRWRWRSSSPLVFLFNRWWWWWWWRRRWRHRSSHRARSRALRRRSGRRNGWCNVLVLLLHGRQRRRWKGSSHRTDGRRLISLGHSNRFFSLFGLDSSGMHSGRPRNEHLGHRLSRDHTRWWWDRHGPAGRRWRGRLFSLSFRFVRPRFGLILRRRWRRSWHYARRWRHGHSSGRRRRCLFLLNLLLERCIATQRVHSMLLGFMFDRVSFFVHRFVVFLLFFVRVHQALGLFFLAYSYNLAFIRYMSGIYKDTKRPINPTYPCSQLDKESIYHRPLLPHTCSLPQHCPRV